MGFKPLVVFLNFGVCVPRGGVTLAHSRRVEVHPFSRSSFYDSHGIYGAPCCSVLGSFLSNLRQREVCTSHTNWLPARLVGLRAQGLVSCILSRLDLDSRSQGLEAGDRENSQWFDFQGSACGMHCHVLPQGRCNNEKIVYQYNIQGNATHRLPCRGQSLQP